jgi:DNA-binding NtrC family response regulator
MTGVDKNDLAFGGTAVVRNTSRGPLLARDPGMRDALTVLDRVASSMCTVLVTGESGTGKELAVAALHDASPRAARPLVAVNCGAIPDNLVESELFGHARGAFTGAVATRQGYVAAAEGGTLFLDEIGELSPLVQVKLLRLLQQREYTPVGDTRVVRCDVRIVAATNRDLAAEVASGRFREDLFWRLNVIHVHLPALRDRRADIPLLARHFLKTCSERAGRPDVLELAPDALARIAAADWPGNVRALENAIERAVLLSPGPVVPADCVQVRDRASGVVRIAKATMDAFEAGSAPEPTSMAVPAGASSPAPVATLPPPSPVSMFAAAVPTFASEAPGVLDAPERLATVVPLYPATAALRSSGTFAVAAPYEPSAVAPEDAAEADAKAMLDEGDFDLRAAVDAYENTIIREALRRSGNNKSRAAQLLGLQRTTLIEMMKRKGIEGLKRVA